MVRRNLTINLLIPASCLIIKSMDDVAIFYDERVEGRDTQLSFCLRIDNGLHFFLRTLCRLYEKPNKVYVPRWLAEKKGLV